MYYLCYWFTLLTQAGVGYRCGGPVAVPTLFLYDDYMNFNSANFGQTCLLMVMWWFALLGLHHPPSSTVCGLLSGLTGLVERQGAVRDAEPSEHISCDLP